MLPHTRSHTLLSKSKPAYLWAALMTTILLGVAVGVGTAMASDVPQSDVDVCDVSDGHSTNAGRSSRAQRTYAQLLSPFDACGPLSNYTVISDTGASLLPASTDIGNHCDDCTTPITLPFSYSLYDQSFTQALVGSNGVMGFITNTNSYRNYALPISGYNYTIFPHWDDLRTDAQTGCSAYVGGCGIFTSEVGSAPYRTFLIEWRAVLRVTNTPVNFELILYEEVSAFDIVYGSIANNGSSATVGV